MPECGRGRGPGGPWLPVSPPLAHGVLCAPGICVLGEMVGIRPVSSLHVLGSKRGRGLGLVRTGLSEPLCTP